MISSIVASLTFLLFVFLILLPVTLTIIGVVLAFRASVILGIACLFLHPMALILGICFLFGKANTAQEIAKLLKLRL